jgi:hypothetical protein
VLDLIHFDVCGPISVESVSGFKYFVLFIDDYSKKRCIYFLKTKDILTRNLIEERRQQQSHQMYTKIFWTIVHGKTPDGKLV